MAHVDDTLTQKDNRMFVSNAMKQPLLSLKIEIFQFQYSARLTTLQYY